MQRSSVIVRKETSKKYGDACTLDDFGGPTSACNLKCTGCWAAEYGHQMSMDLETLDRIITEAKALGIYMFIFSGGEPLVRKKDIIKLCEKHTDCYFLAFTNGTLIDEAFADDMLRVGNLHRLSVSKDMKKKRICGVEKVLSRQ